MDALKDELEAVYRNTEKNLEYNVEQFPEHKMKELHQMLDLAVSMKNIDTSTSDDNELVNNEIRTWLKFDLRSNRSKSEKVQNAINHTRRLLTLNWLSFVNEKFKPTGDKSRKVLQFLNPQEREAIRKREDSFILDLMKRNKHKSKSIKRERYSSQIIIIETFEQSLLNLCEKLTNYLQTYCPSQFEHIVILYKYLSSLFGLGEWLH
ncbi:hypothetical protein SNEBB_006394 [Seison nebaliae]|nr:hypothetical protein SNEBB_006394 [Seison nebaliae]